MTQRVRRSPDGTFNGSTSAMPDDSNAAYARSAKAAERAEDRANKLLGY
jgi:hypothetical protein